MKVRRRRSTGHVIRMRGSEMPNRIMNYNPDGKTRVGRYKVRWIDVNNDMRKAGVRLWRKEGEVGDGWWRILGEVETELGLRWWCWW